MIQNLKEFFKKETVLCVAFVCAILTMFLVPIDVQYIEYIDVKTLCLLLCLMAVVEGIKGVGAFDVLTYQLLSKIKNGRILCVTLVLLPFFSSMLVTNDVALLVFVPFTLGLLKQLQLHKAMIPVLVLQTVAANLGSMATPVGNPQNLYLYANYNLGFDEFISVVLPLTIISFVALILSSIPVLKSKLPNFEIDKVYIKDTKKLVIYSLLFVVCLLTVFRIIHYAIMTSIVLISIFVLDKEKIKELDIALLFTFICFFIVSGNLGRVEWVCNFLQGLLEKNALLTSIGASQIISNVPAAVLLSNFTDNWQALLAGVNIGGLGTPIASLASLITLKLYLRDEHANVLKFLGFFTIVNIIGLVVLIVISL